MKKQHLAKLTFKDLQKIIDEMGERFPRFADDDLFVLWFLRAYVLEDELQCADAICGVSNDKGVDALVIDDNSQAVFVVQGKYREQLGKKSEGRSDVMAFADIADFLYRWADEDCNAFLKDANEAVAERLREARKKTQKKNYRALLYFATTGKVSPTIRKDAQQKVRKASKLARIEVIDGNRAMVMFRDYLDGVAPPIPSLDLELESGRGITVRGVAQRLDESTKINSWVFSMRGDAVAELYEIAGRRLFARNIRGFMGMKTSVNREMIETLEHEPERFFYYNNGITLVCDDARLETSQGRDIMTVSNPQVINGQQTTRTLANFRKLAADASVLVKVICVPRNVEGDGEVYDELISRIVQGTNWQNAIKQSDLMANDRRQIDLERSLRKVGYRYLRKRQSKSEVRATVGQGHGYLVTKEELAQASAGCELDPYIIRAGREKLFSEELYDKVFPHSEPYYYILRYRLMKEISWASKGTPERGYAKWMILNFMWSQIRPLVTSKAKKKAFRRMCEKQEEELVVPLNRAINTAFVQALKFYRTNRGSGDSAQDISTYFRSRKGLHTQFRKAWRTIPSSTARTFDIALNKIDKALSQYAE